MTSFAKKLSKAEAYHADYSRISKGMLQKYIKSRKDYFDFFVAQTREPPHPSPSTVNIGDVVHKCLLEKLHLQDCVRRYPHDCYRKDGGLNGHRAKEFRAELPAGVHAIKEMEWRTITGMVNAVNRHRLGQIINHDDAKFEEIIQWEDETGLPCRAMVDFHMDMDTHILALDLKCTSSIYPQDFQKIGNRLGYWLQDSHYSSGLEKIYGKPVVFRFWCLEIGRPYRIAPREYDQISKETGKEAYRKYMEELSNCYDNNEWTDPWTEDIDYMTLSPWDVGEVNEEQPELTGFGDE